MRQEGAGLGIELLIERNVIPGFIEELQVGLLSTREAGEQAGHDNYRRLPEGEIDLGALACRGLNRSPHMTIP